MNTLDWVILAATLCVIVLYGTIKGRGSRDVQGFLLANRSLKWYTVAFSIMATQASAITFISTPGQAYVDGMRFVQYYFGLPLAMVILAITAVPIYHKLGVYTAYEYIERRFDAKTRVLTTLLFLFSRGLSAGMTIYAPALVLSVMLSLDIRLTSALIGGLVIVYSATGGVKAVNYSHTVQFGIVMFGMTLAFVVAVFSLPSDISLADGLRAAAVTGRLHAVDFSFDWHNRYNFWSGVIGGMFVALAYFGTDQSQVQRYLTGASVAQSRLGLLFNGLVKVPMQFGILLLGLVVFVFFQFNPPPLFFNPNAVEEARTANPHVWSVVEQKQHDVWQENLTATRRYLDARRRNDALTVASSRSELLESQSRLRAIHAEASALVQQANPSYDPSDTNYIFLSFALKFLPVGIIGLVFACIFAASMSSSSGELSALATTSVVDIYKRFVRKEGTERHYLLVSRIAMAAWGMYAIAFSQIASRLGSLVEAVNILGSLFYGTMLGVFLLGFYFRRVGGTATFVGALAGEAVVLWCFAFTSIAWLWYNVIGCAVVILVASTWTMLKQNEATGMAASS